MYKFIKKKGYYTGVAYEWNIPTGHSCPFAKECKVNVDRETGKFQSAKGAYTCYVASAERFPCVRDRRWENYDFVRKGGKPVLPKDCKHLRIHSSGDFFSQKYFDMWIEIAKENPDVEMWAYTKSLRYWVARLGEIPDNLVLNASWGGHATPKPIALCERVVKSSCPEGGLVIDFFLGSGSTMVAVHQLKRKCYGMELDPKYCQVIIDRMRKLDPELVITRNGELYV